MNFLTFIFSLLLLISFGTHLILEKQNSQKKIRNSIVGHLAAQRKILSQTEQKRYQSIPLPITGTETTPPTKHTPSQKKAPELPDTNPECAKINLFPLIQEGREIEPFLYEITTKIIKTMYGPHLFKEHPKEEIPFLTAFLQISKKAIEKKESFALEKLFFNNPKWQRIYYRMLKGSKQFPSLLDVIKASEIPSKICLSHAHPFQLQLLFGPKIGTRLFQEIHEDPPTPLTKELITQLYTENHALTPEISVLNSIEYSSAHAHKDKKTYIAKDNATNITLKKNVYNR